MSIGFLPLSGGIWLYCVPSIVINAMQIAVLSIRDRSPLNSEKFHPVYLFVENSPLSCHTASFENDMQHNVVIRSCTNIVTWSKYNITVLLADSKFLSQESLTFYLTYHSFI